MQKRSSHSYKYAEKSYSGGNHQSSAVYGHASMVMDAGCMG